MSSAVVCFSSPLVAASLSIPCLATSRGPYPGLSLEVGGRSDMAVVMVPAKEGVLLTDKEEVEGWRVLAFLVC